MTRCRRHERSRIMAAVKSQDTKPEMAVRRMVHALGFRYRLHVRALPGSPDMVFPSRRKVIFVHGCFWHRHRCEGGRSMPASNVSYWTAKFERNRLRDRRNRRLLWKLGWKVLVLWECQIGRKERLLSRIVAFLEAP
jgi:DNA mismatch endonuclease, patch repair protein